MFDEVRHRLGLRFDADLARVTEISTATLSKMRHRTQPIGAMTLIRLHEATGMSIAQIRALMGDHRPHWR